MHKKYVLLLASLLATSAYGSEPIFKDDYNSYSGNEDLRKSWTGFGRVLANEIYYLPNKGNQYSGAACYVGDWKKGSSFSAIYALDDQDLTSAKMVTVTAFVETNRFVQEVAPEPSEFRIRIKGSNGDVWESRSNQVVSEVTLSDYSFEISENKMVKKMDITGSGSLLDTLASVSGLYIIFENAGKSGVQDFIIDDFTITSEAND